MFSLQGCEKNKKNIKPMFKRDGYNKLMLLEKHKYTCSVAQIEQTANDNINLSSKVHIFGCYAHVQQGTISYRVWKADKSISGKHMLLDNAVCPMSQSALALSLYLQLNTVLSSGDL